MCESSNSVGKGRSKEITLDIKCKMTLMMIKFILAIMMTKCKITMMIKLTMTIMIKNYYDYHDDKIYEDVPVCPNPVQYFKLLKYLEYLEYSNYFEYFKYLKYFNIQTCPCVRILSPKFTASPSRSSSTSFAGSRQILVR